MLLFVAVERALLESHEDEIQVPPSAVYTDLSEVVSDQPVRAVLVYDRKQLSSAESGPLKLSISDANNGRPFRPPLPVVAAGGYVVRESSAGHEVLVIKRRGVWDLPKGKLDAGETIEQAALREVREEVGAENLRILRSLGVTVHGYPHRDRYAVKTTHWFLMTTTSAAFAPQTSEDIEAVRWVPWEDAPRLLGYETLREHSASIQL